MLSSLLISSFLLSSIAQAAGTLTYTSYVTTDTTTTVTSSGYPQVATTIVTQTVKGTTTTPRTVATQVVTGDASTTTIYNVPTSIVPFQPGFTPVLLEPEYTASYPTITSYAVGATDTVTVGGPPTTTTTITTTITKATATAFNPITATSTYTPVSVSFGSTTATVITSHAACQVSQNYASLLPQGPKFNFPYTGEDADQNSIRLNFIGEDISVQDCCEACYSRDNCIGSYFFPPSYPGDTETICTLFVNEGTCNASDTVRVWHDNDESDFTVVISNGPGRCGQQKPLLANHPPGVDQNNYPTR